jgi:hypothetical protein
VVPWHMETGERAYKKWCLGTWKLEKGHIKVGPWHMDTGERA